MVELCPVRSTLDHRLQAAHLLLTQGVDIAHLGLQTYEFRCNVGGLHRIRGGLPPGSAIAIRRSRRMPSGLVSLGSSTLMRSWTLIGRPPWLLPARLSAGASGPFRTPSRGGVAQLPAARG